MGSGGEDSALWHSGLYSIRMAAMSTEARTGSYRELKKMITEAGLLEKQPRFYAYKISTAILMIAGAITLVVVIGESWWQLGGAVVLALAGMQAALLGHDGGHRQIFHSIRKNDFVPLLLTGPVLGLNLSWWMDEHNLHHGLPNHETRDPNIDMRFWAFTEQQRGRRQGFYRWMVKYQAFAVIPLNMLGGFYKVIESGRYIKNRKLRHPRLEQLGYVVYWTWLLSLAFIVMSPLQAVAFLVVYYAVFGLSLGALIAPNHKGMLMVDDDHDLDFLRWQVLTARNVRGGRLTDFFYGGLNYQIEHHLFPTMPRNLLPQAVKIVEPYCKKHGISYHTTGVAEGFWEILREMHRLRVPETAVTNGGGGAEVTSAPSTSDVTS